MKTRTRFLPILLLAAAAFLALTPPAASAKSFQRGSILDALVNKNGAEALVAAVQVVDESGVAAVSIAEVLGDRRNDLVLFAPSNAAFESLLGLDAGALDGLTIAEIKDALPGLLPEGVGPREISAILAKHVGIASRTSRYTISSDALLRAGSIKVVDGSELPIGIGSKGVEINYETTIILPDVRTRNGFIHYIDKVILDGLLAEQAN